MPSPLHVSREPSARTTAPAAPALDWLRAELAALPDAELLLVNLDIPALAHQLRARLSELRRMQGQRPARCPDAGQDHVARLESCVQAVLRAHARYVELQARSSSPSAVAAELAKLRQRLLHHAKDLVGAGALPASAVEPYRLAQSHRAMARTVCGLAGVFLTHWQQLRERTQLELPELERAIELARELSALLQGTARAHDELARALRERQQLFTLLIKQYADLRRSARALHGKERAAELLPSLYRKEPPRSQRSPTSSRSRRHTSRV